MSTELAKRESIGEAVERVLIGGDLAKLNPEERVSYYKSVCESVGLNPLTRPLEYIQLNGKLTLYARKDATDQLRANNQVSITIQAREVVEGCYVVTARAEMPSGRTDESIGAVPIEGLKGEPRSNAMMKCETKAKRRVTLSICGMGLLDESEIDSIPGAKVGEPAVTTAPKVFGKPKDAIAGAVVKEGGPALSSEKALEGPDSKTAPTFQPLPPLEELLETAKEIKPEPPSEFIDKQRQDWLRLKFKESLPLKYQGGPIADQMRRGWLKSEGFVNEKDEGTSTVIPDKQFKKVAAAMLNWAKEQQ